MLVNGESQGKARMSSESINEKSFLFTGVIRSCY